MENRQEQLIEENRRLAQRCLELEAASRQQLEKLRAANAVLTRGEADLRALLENASIGFALTDLNLRIASANQTLASVIGYGTAELAGINFTNFVYVGKLPAFNRLVGRDSRAATAGEIIELVARDGAHVSCRVVASDWLDENNAPRGHFLLVLDAAPELALAGRLRETEQATAELEKCHALFTEVAAHELRAPARGMMDISRMLTEEGFANNRVELARTIHAYASSIARMLDDLADVAGPDAAGLRRTEDAAGAGGGLPNQEPVDLHDLTRGIVNLFAVRAEEKGLELRIRVMPGIPGVVMLDPHSLRRALAHLLDNSIRSTDAGRITLSVDVVGDRLRFMVTDTGRGATPEGGQDFSAPRRHGGAGAGLAICRRIVAAMDGSVGHESDPGRGSESYFMLPLAPARRQ